MPVITDPVVAAAVTNTNQAGSAIIGKVGTDITTPGTTNNVALGIGVPAAAGVTKAEDAASASGDVGVAALVVQKATPGDLAGTDGDYAFPQMSAGRLWTSTINGGFTGETTTQTTSADLSSVTNITAAPTSTQKLILDRIVVSTLTAMNLQIKEETSGTLLCRLNLAANSGPVALSLGIKLPTADKKFTATASVSGQIDITAIYHSEA